MWSLKLMNRSWYFVFFFGISQIVCSEGWRSSHGRPIYLKNLNKRVTLNEDGTCYTREGQKGACLQYEKCPELVQAAESRNDLSNFLLKRTCSFIKSGRTFCCLNNTGLIAPPLVKPPSTPSKSILPSFKECGYSDSSRVKNGDIINHGSHPWLVGVGYLTENNTFKVECGGTLITRKHVLTAAHCFIKQLTLRTIPNHDLTHVILGEHSLSRSDEKEDPIVLPIAKRTNPGYDPTRFYDDISLLVLEKEVQFTNYIRPACLPFERYQKYFNYSTNKLNFVGWGRTDYNDAEGTDKPMEMRVSLVPKPRCQEVYGASPHRPIDHTQICFTRNGSNFCRGDSGGPLVYEEQDRFFRNFLVAIAVFGDFCDENTRNIGVYTYVPEYLTWIENNL